MISLKFESKLKATPEQVWKRITSVEGLTSEMWPIFTMTAPKEIKTLDDIYTQADKILFRSWILLGGIIPVDYTDLRLKSLDSGKGFVEESNMGSMKYWRHERKVVPLEQGYTVVIDELTFEPRYLKKLSQVVVRYFFNHRHKNLKKYWNS